MKCGTMFYNKNNERIDVGFSNGEQYGGLHCGQTFEVKINGRWVSTRIEKADDWFLIGLNDIDLCGLKIRI